MPLRILVLAPHPFFQERGTPLAVREVIRFLARCGHRVDVLTYQEGEPCDIPGVEIFRIPRLPGIHGIRPGFSFRKVLCDVAMWVTMRKLLRTRSYDLVHAVEESVFLALYLRWVRGLPFVYDMDSQLSQQLRERWRWIRVIDGPLVAAEARAMRESEGVLTVCRALEQQVESLAPDVLTGRAEDLSLMVCDDDQAPPDDLPADGVIAMYVGNLEPYQGIEVLLASMVPGQAAGPPIRLVIIGGIEKHIAAYRSRAADLGIAARVDFLGPRPVQRLGSYLRRADIVVSPRLKGVNTPMKIYSYMASGTAILATDLTTHTQVLDDDVACLVNPDPASMGAGLSRLAADQGLRERLGRAARDLYLRAYGPEAYERKLTVFYDQVCERLAERRTAPAGSPR